VARKGADYIGTMAVQEKHRFDEQRLTEFMSRNVEGFVAPVRADGDQRLVVVRRAADGTLTRASREPVRFVPLVPDRGDRA